MRISAGNCQQQCFGRDRSKSPRRVRSAHRSCGHANAPADRYAYGHSPARDPTPPPSRQTPAGVARHVSWRLPGAARHVRRQPRAWAHRCGARLQRRPAAVGRRRLQSHLRVLPPERGNARRHFPSSTRVHDGHRSVRSRIIVVRRGPRERHPDRRAHVGGIGRRLANSRFAGDPFGCLSRGSATGARHRHLGRL